MYPYFLRIVIKRLSEGVEEWWDDCRKSCYTNDYPFRYTTQMSKTLIHHIGTQEEYDNGDPDSKIIRRRVVCIHFDGYFSPQWHSPPNLLKKVYVYATLGAVFRGDALELYLARPVPAEAYPPVPLL